MDFFASLSVIFSEPETESAPQPSTPIDADTSKNGNTGYSNCTVA